MLSMNCARNNKLGKVLGVHDRQTRNDTQPAIDARFGSELHTVGHPSSEGRLTDASRMSVKRLQDAGGGGVCRRSNA